MAWRPYENLIDGELDNRVPGRVNGWIRFFRSGSTPLKVAIDLAGDFHEDIRGKVIWLKNPNPTDRNEVLDRDNTYMKGFSAVQSGEVGDITAGLALGPWTSALAEKLMAQNELIWQQQELSASERQNRRQLFDQACRKHIKNGDLYYTYVEYPYIEWYSEDNGRVVLELDASQVEILERDSPQREKTAADMLESEKKRTQAFGKFMTETMDQISRQNRDHGGDGKVFGVVIE
jgi:hypothetical protein